jgi:hypothetical protein
VLTDENELVLKEQEEIEKMEDSKNAKKPPVKQDLTFK